MLLYNITALLIVKQYSKVQAPNVRIMHQTNTHRHCQPELLKHGSTVSHSTRSSPSRVTTVLWLRHWMSRGFSLLRKPPTSNAQNTPSASLLTPSVPELRFSTRVWWTCRDAHWARAVTESSMQTGTNLVNEQSRKSLEKQTCGYC